MQLLRVLMLKSTYLMRIRSLGTEESNRGLGQFLHDVLFLMVVVVVVLVVRRETAREDTAPITRTRKHTHRVSHWSRRVYRMLWW